jgi:hypothetical protein
VGLSYGSETVCANVLGDLNGDGEVGVEEAILALRVAAGEDVGFSEPCVLTGAGPWELGTTYQMCDVVSFNDAFYAALMQHQASTATSPPDSTYWRPLSIGTEGPPGPRGYNSLIAVTDEPQGSNCTNGGKKISAGTDTNRNNILDTSEVSTSTYLCLTGLVEGHSWEYFVDVDRDGASGNFGDCNNLNPVINANGREICGDGIDQDCDGHDAPCRNTDNDNDGYTDLQGDCDDTNPFIHPGLADRCGDLVDRNCDGQEAICNETTDPDHDDFTAEQGDCNNNDPLFHPYAPDLCGDGIDHDCNGSESGCCTVFTAPAPGYGAAPGYGGYYYGGEIKTTVPGNGAYCHPDDVDNDGDGFTENQGDCNDADSSINPSLTTPCPMHFFGNVDLAAGGTVFVNSGVLAGAKIVVPAGAGSGSMPITISSTAAGSVSSYTAVGPGVVFSVPPGTVFATPVTISIPYNPASLAASGKISNDIVLYASNGIVPGPYTIDQANQVVSINVTRLDSTFWSAVWTGPPGVTEATNVFLQNADGSARNGITLPASYYFIHGSTSPDGSKFFISINDGDNSGATNLYMFDTGSITADDPTLATGVTHNTGTITGDNSGPQGATITFRSTWTADGTRILLAGADRFFVLDADTLEVLNGNTAGDQGDKTIGGSIEGQNHDAIPTDDGAYAILTLRTKPNGIGGNTDGAIQLYDVVNGEPIGEPVSICNSCHGDDRTSVLCGLDGTITSNDDGTAPGYGAAGTADTYDGTIYVAGHGAHIAKINLTIDPNDTTNPITINSNSNINIGSPGDTDYLLHDVRKDGDKLYWSTYKVDHDGNLHYGHVDMANNNAVVDITYSPDARADATGNNGSVGGFGGFAPGAGPYYCASGQTADYHMPISMSSEGYITVIPKNTETASGDNTSAGVYEGTIYVAGHGAHIAKATITVDPSNTSAPITVDSLAKINIGSPGNADYHLHDVRKDGDTLYWSTYHVGSDGNLHYGSVGTDGSGLVDNTIAPAPRDGTNTGAAGDGPYYCASGQTDAYHLPISMSNEGYITVIDKSGANAPTQVYPTDSLAVPSDYYFFHGSTSPDGSKFLLSVNYTGGSGNTNLYMVDTDSVVAGTPTLATSVTNNTATLTGDNSGPQGATITFRSTWTPGAKKILMAGGDRFYVLDADTLAVLNGTAGDTTIGGSIEGQNHDALATADSRYAILTLRTKPNGADGNTDGAIQLYDVNNGTPVGEPVSVCNGCHGDDRTSILCGLDGDLQLVR